MAQPPVLRGRRVTLRPFSAGFSDEELSQLFRWSRDDEVLALAGGSPLDVSLGRFRDLFRAQLSGRNSDHEQMFAILDADGRLIGRTGLIAIDRKERRAELGIVIGEPDCWDRGYGRDAVRALVDFGFGVLGLARIVLHTYPENERARRAFRAAGFRAVREMERFSLELGSHTEIEMEMLAPDVTDQPTPR
jgi:RimJ/RimL family protein N-acetyltransferase